jgi:hypothetical protein
VHPQLSPLSDPRLLFAQVLLNFSRSLEMAYEADGKEKYVSFYDRYNPQVTINFQRDVDSIDKPGQKSLFQSFRGALPDLSTRVPSKYLDYFITIDQGQLQISLNFSPRYFKYSTIEHLAESYLKELRAFIQTD